MNWFLEHYDEILAIIGGTVSVATIVVKLTPTPKDDAVLARVIHFLSRFSLIKAKTEPKP